MHLKRFLYKNKEIIATCIAMLACAIIGVDWKYVSQKYPTHTQWAISFSAWMLMLLCYSQKKVKDDDGTITNFKDPFL